MKTTLKTNITVVDLTGFSVTLFNQDAANHRFVILSDSEESLTQW